MGGRKVKVTTGQESGGFVDLHVTGMTTKDKEYLLSLGLIKAIETACDKYKDWVVNEAVKEAE